MVLTAVVWALLLFLIFCSLQPAAAERLLGAARWQALQALRARMDAAIKSYANYTPQLAFDAGTPALVRDIVTQGERARLERAAARSEL